MSLLQMSLQGGILILVVAVLRAATVHLLPKRTFLILWEVVLLRLLIPVSIPSVTSVYSLLGRSEVIGSLEETPVGAAVTAVQGQLAAGGGVSAGQGAGSGAASALSVWFVVWLAGALVCGAFFALSYLHWRVEFSASLPVQNAFAALWLAEHPLLRPVSIRQSDRIAAPLTYGIVKPVILMPKQTDWENASQLSYIFLHEYVHIRHFDGVKKLLAALALCIHWCNPLVWVMYALFQRDIELACDECVIRRFGDASRADYSYMLIRMEARQSGLLPFCNSFSRNAIRERIIAIMKTRKTSIGVYLISAAAILSILALFATTGASGGDRQSAQEIASYEALGLNLTDEDAFALVDIGADANVLLIADGTFDDGYGNAAAIRCSAYCVANGVLYDLGTLESPESKSTAYSVRIGSDCIYTASNSSVERYRLDANSKRFVLDAQYRIVYDADGGEACYRVQGGAEETVTEETFWAAFAAYEDAAVINFEDA
ncbi:MAG: M56 family metallopeptidase [Clostridiales bacterium]|nr:M56 family metallopeptidase [Clostridiales bacterium]